jgi:hypothetical protein
MSRLIQIKLALPLAHKPKPMNWLKNPLSTITRPQPRTPSVSNTSKGPWALT